MANLKSRQLYGYINNIKNKSTASIGVQYHITTKCDLRCRHCYMGDSMPQPELSLEENRKLLLDFEKYLLQHNKRASMYITGGDPILSEKFWDTLSFIENSKCLDGTVILGNSFHLNSSVIREMKLHGVYGYQISLDGLEINHDRNRREGSFQDAIRALKLLHDMGVETYVMFTVTKSNYRDFIPLYKLLDSMGIVDTICFDKMIPMGEALNRNDYISQQEYKNFMLDVYKFIVFEKPHMMFSFKDNLWKLLLSELGMVSPYLKGEQEILNGCVACDGSSVTILADGTVMPCRRLDIEFGKYPQKSFAELLDNNEFYNSLSNPSNYTKCNECELFSFCRGCLAIKYSMGGNVYGEDKYCWKKCNEFG